MAVELPTATVTFLFTDIVESTRRWEQDASGMSAALARHDELLRSAVGTNGGVVFSTGGDGLAAVFARAAAAIKAAVMAQQALTAEPGPDPLRVRMGLHTGEAEERGGDYFGPAVNRAARLMAVATGAQILVSMATVEVVRDGLPPDPRHARRPGRGGEDLARPRSGTGRAVRARGRRGRAGGAHRARRARPGLTLLATSREPLALPYEQVYRVAPLPLPAPDQRDDLADIPSVALFLQRARRARPDFTVDDVEMAEIASVVRRLDGMPLAIELAAGRLSSLGLSDVTSRLDRALDVLGSGARAGERHGSLRAAITWSYELLPDDERRLFRALAVFPDGFDLATSEDIAREVAPSTDPTTAVGHLVDASMLIARFGKVLRYRMLETLRSFALDRLADAGELEAATSPFVAWAVRLVRRIDAEVVTAAEAAASDRLLAEVGNVRAAWTTARGRDDLGAAAAIVVSLWWPLYWREHNEMWNWASELAADDRILAHPAASSVLASASQAEIVHGRLHEGRVLAQQGLDLVDPDDEAAIGRCLLQLASTSPG